MSTQGRVRVPTSLRTLAARGTIITAIFSVGVGLLNLARGFILAAFLTRRDYGIWGIIVVSLSTLVWLKQAGVGDRFVQQDDEDQVAAFQRAFTLDLVLTLACVVLIALALPLLVVIYDLPQLVLPGLVVALGLLVSVFQAPLWILYRRMEFGRQRLITAVDPVVGFVVAVALAVAGAGYWTFVGGFLAGICAASLVAVATSDYPLRWRWEPGAMHGMWNFSRPLLLAGLAGFVMAWSAVVTAKLALGVAAVGVITLADNIAAFSERVDDLLTGALYPAICAARDRPAVLYESLVKSNRLALMWAVPFGLAIALFSADLVHFGIGERWRPAVVVLAIYGITAAINHVGFNWTAYFKALENTRPIALESGAAAAVFVLTGIPLLLLFGLPGFAIGIALQSLAAVAMRAWWLQQIFSGFDFLRHAVRAFLPTLPGVAVVLVARALEPRRRTLAMAVAELLAFAVVTMACTWYAESPLLREARGVLRPGSTPAV